MENFLNDAMTAAVVLLFLGALLAEVRAVRHDRRIHRQMIRAKIA